MQLVYPIVSGEKMAGAPSVISLIGKGSGGHFSSCLPPSLQVGNIQHQGFKSGLSMLKLIYSILRHIPQNYKKQIL